MSEKIMLNMTNIELTLPPHLKIIRQDDYEVLQAQSQLGKYMDLKDVLALLSVSRPWFCQNVLYNPKFRKQIDIDHNPDGFVKYPRSQGDKYLFLASRTRAFFEANFKDILA